MIDVVGERIGIVYVDGKKEAQCINLSIHFLCEISC